MKIIEKNIELKENTVVAIGNFDGIHLGHIELIKESKKAAIRESRKLVVLTFCSKLTKIKSGKIKSLLTSEKQKHTLFEKLGVDIVYKMEFDEGLKNMTPKEFIDEILFKKLNAKDIFVGRNFKFGFNRLGDVDFLSNYNKDLKVNIIGEKKIDGEIISSSKIRLYLIGGNLEKANLLLGRPYTITGTIIRGKGRGKNLGFATANLDMEAEYVPLKNGVYSTKTIYDNKEYVSLTNVGDNPTFGDTGFSIETHLLNFEKDIYGEQIEIRFVKFIREEIKFENIDSLVSQVEEDIDKIKKY